MRLTAPLTERQQQVLRWIADGCPTKAATGHTHKITARALQSRRLVTISTSGGVWSATVTDAGAYYLQHGVFPPRRPLSPSVSSHTTSDHGSATTRPRAPATMPPREHPLSPTAQLVADVLAAGGRLTVSPDRGYYQDLERVVRSANRYRKTPPGTRLVHHVVYDSERWTAKRQHVVQLAEGPAGTGAPLLPVPVPDEVSRYHPAVAALRKTTRIAITAEARSRALRILHAVAVASERRGYTVTAHTPKDPHNSPATRWHLLLTINNEIVPLYVSEETDRPEHAPNGRLRIDLGGLARSERPSFWADRTHWRLEDKLPELLREIAVRADELRLKREAKTRAEQEYRQALEQERQRALARATDAHRRTVLDNQLTQWRQARELRQYAAALEEQIAAAEASQHGDSDATRQARRWLTWVSERAEQQDPLRSLPDWPQAPHLPAYKLTEFVQHVPEPPDMRYQPETY